ncbi:MAG: hypothetical protein EA349_14430 [Halomonadaceae bacterium]|nr:MAG: hypothetical protein EA349_14430 [Halomonadaceae bacterium]
MMTHNLQAPYMPLRTRFRAAILLSLTALPLNALASISGMQSLNDEEMSSVSGQAGLVIESETRATIDRLSYITNGNGIHFDGIELGAASQEGGVTSQRHDISLRDSGSMNILFEVDGRRLTVDDIRLSDRPDLSMGGFYLDQNRIRGNLTISPGGATSDSGFGYDLFYSSTGGRFGYRTNDNHLILDGLGLNFFSLGMSLDMEGDVAVFRAPQVGGQFAVGAIRYGQSPDNFRGALNELPSMGGLTLDFGFSSRFDFQAGGRFGNEGLQINSSTLLNRGAFIYSTNGYNLALRDLSGESHLRDLRMDVARDGSGRLGLALTLGEAEGELNIGRIELGNSGSVGGLNLQWLYADQLVNDRNYSNQVFIQGGGNPHSGPQGLRLGAEWSLADGQIGYTTNGNTLYITGIQSWGEGDVTLDVTRDGTLEGTEFYDGLRIGFEGMAGGYRSEGLRVGSENAERQAGMELLGLHQAFEYDALDGQITLGPIGEGGGEGLLINADIIIRDALSGALLNEDDTGVWAAGRQHDIVLRDMTLQVTDNGLALVLDEGRQLLDIGDLRIGHRDSSHSFGRVSLQTYETGSEMTISGLGDGSEGLRIFRKRILAEEVDDDRRNRFVWETGRQSENGVPVNGSGLQLVLENIHTSDGADLTGQGGISNTFGLQTDTRINVRNSTRTAGEPLGLGFENRTRFRELNVGSMDLVHPTGGAATALHGISLQNMDIRSDLVVTPIR